VGVDEAVATDELPTATAPINVANATNVLFLKIALPRMLKTESPFNSGLMQPMCGASRRPALLADYLIMP
jgi:hypothetical protein